LKEKELKTMLDSLKFGSAVFGRRMSNIYEYTFKLCSITNYYS